MIIPKHPFGNFDFVSSFYPDARLFLASVFCEDFFGGIYADKQKIF